MGSTGKIRQAQLCFGDDAGLTLKKVKKTPPLPVNNQQTDEMKEEEQIPQEFKAFIQKCHKKGHDWLFYGQVNNTKGNFCSLCQDYKKTCHIILNSQQKTFIETASKNLKTSAPKDHAASFIHLSAYVWKFGPIKKEEDPTLQDYDARAKLTTEDMMIHFLSVYFLSKECIALRKVEGLCDLFDLSNVKFNEKYRNKTMAREILIAISEKISQDMIKEIKASPALGLMIDESTDNTSIQYLNINIKYLYEGEVKEKCCGVFELLKTDSESIFEVLLDFLSQHKLTTKITAISTDGASVMISEGNGVVGRLKNYTKNENLIITHCLSHRLNLGAKDLWSDEKSLANFNTLIHSLCSYFSRSPKRLKILDEEEEELLDFHLRLLTPIDIRWLSFYHAIERIYKLYPAIISALQRIVDDEFCVTAEGLVKRMSSIQFVGLLHIFQDLSAVLDPLNSLFQKKDLKLGDAYREISDAIDSLQKLSDSSSYGTYVQSFLDMNNEKTSVKFHDTELSSLYNFTLETVKNKSKYLQKRLLHHLKLRFPCQEEFELFSIFDVETIFKKSSEEGEEEFGKDKIAKLAKKYELDECKTKVEWDKFKLHVQKHLKADKEAGIWSFMLNNIAYKFLTRLIQIYLTIPISTSGCERVFSKLNLIKTQLRNQMEPDTLNHHLMVTMNGSELEDLTEDDLIKSIQIWKGFKPRRFTLTKK